MKDLISIQLSVAFSVTMAMLFLQTLGFGQKNTVSYDFANLRSGYAPIHICWQRQLSDRFAFEAVAARFKSRQIAVPTAGESKIVQYYPDDLVFRLVFALSYRGVDEEAFTTAFNQKGAFLELGIKRYFGSKPKNGCRF